MKSKWKQTDVEYVQSIAVIQHFFILNKFAIPTDEYCNPLQVILKL